MGRDELPPGGVELSPAGIAALGPRWSRCWRPEEVAERLAGVTAPWYVAGGWAVDLFHGRTTRAHGDIEIGIPVAGFAEIRDRFPGLALDAAGSGRIWADAAPDVLAAVPQTWLRDPVSGDYRLDVFREPHDGDTWICRRDESIRRPYGEIIRRTDGGIPYLAPEFVLLFKAKATRPKDQADFDSTVPQLTAARRATLAALLAQVHPGHPWIGRL